MVESPRPEWLVNAFNSNEYNRKPSHLEGIWFLILECFSLRCDADSWKVGLLVYIQPSSQNVLVCTYNSIPHTTGEYMITYIMCLFSKFNKATLVKV